MTNKELFYFTGKCLTLEEHPGFREELIEKIKAQSIDWSKFVEFCSNHLILPIIYLKFKDAHLLEFMPDELAHFLKEIYLLNTDRNDQLENQTIEIIRTLNANNIYPIILKGVGNLLEGFYNDRGERMIGDIDLLVSESEYQKSAALLEQNGYAKGDQYFDDLQNVEHYPRLAKKGAPAYVEVHRLPVPHEFCYLLNSELIDTEKLQLKKDYTSFVLSYKHRAIHNFIHSQLANKGHGYGIVSFRDLYDLYLISKVTGTAEAFNGLPDKKRGIAYLVIAGKAFSLPGRFYPQESYFAKIYCLKHDLNLSSALFFYTYRGLKYMGLRIFSLYLGQLFKSFYSRQMRKSIISRLSHRQWYIQHFDSYRNFLKRDKLD